jgi:hypothetical protein
VIIAGFPFHLNSALQFAQQFLLAPPTVRSLMLKDKYAPVNLHEDMVKIDRTFPVIYRA